MRVKSPERMKFLNLVERAAVSKLFAITPNAVPFSKVPSIALSSTPLAPPETIAYPWRAASFLKHVLNPNLLGQHGATLRQRFLLYSSVFDLHSQTGLEELWSTIYGLLSSGIPHRSQ